MELCYLNGDALDTLKNSLPTTYEKYFTERDNSWLAEVCGENPFVKFRDVPDFELAPLDSGLDVSEIDFRNSKTLYKNLNFLTPRQAADERFWAGFCHGAFYDYVRRRWDYYWWAGHVFKNGGLDALGAKDFYTKLFSIATRPFIGNEKLRGGFVKFLQHFNDRSIMLDIDNHIRPAMTELNKIGGAIVLDCLTESEIAAIMIAHTEKILQRQSGTKNLR